MDNKLNFNNGGRINNFRPEKNNMAETVNNFEKAASDVANSTNTKKFLLWGGIALGTGAVIYGACKGIKKLMGKKNKPCAGKEENAGE